MVVGIATYAGVALRWLSQHGDRAGDRVDLHLIAVVHPIEQVGDADHRGEPELPARIAGWLIAPPCSIATAATSGNTTL